VKSAPALWNAKPRSDGIPLGLPHEMFTLWNLMDIPLGPLIFLFHWGKLRIKKKRLLRGASARRYYRWGSYILATSIKIRFKNHTMIDNPGGLNHLNFNNTRHASPLDALLGGFFMSSHSATAWKLNKL